MLQDLTDDQIYRLWQNVDRRMRRDLSGGLSFGVDYQTLRLVSPSWYATIGTIFKEVGRRGGLWKENAA